MKYLCCEEEFNEVHLLNRHYVEKHEVDPENYFFKKLFTRQSYLLDHFCVDGRDEKKKKQLSAGWCTAY